MATPIGTAFQNFLTLLQGDILAVAKPILVQFATNIKANSDPIYVMNQLLLAQAALVMAGPQLEQKAIGQAADLLLQFANSLPNA